MTFHNIIIAIFPNIMNTNYIVDEISRTKLYYFILLTSKVKVFFVVLKSVFKHFLA